MQVNVFDYLDDIIENFEEDKHGELHDLFDAIQFKLNRNSYHMKKIERLIRESKHVSTEHYYEEIHNPIYYEMEGFLVSLRSSVDILLHLLNFCFEFELSSHEVNLHTVYHHPKLPKHVKHIFERYTRPYKNPTWHFIYTFRNETVHERSINQALPIKIDLFTSQEPIAFFELDHHEKEMISFFNQCLRFLDTFSTQLFNAIKISL